MNEKMNFFRTLFKRYFAEHRQLAKIERHQALAKKQLERSVCAAVSRDVSLQQGNYITKEDIDTLQDELTAYFESDQSKW